MLELKLLPKTWHPYLAQEWDKEYLQKLNLFLTKEYKNKKNIFPAKENIFKALELCSPEQVKVVILGQDPYHGAGQAHGLSFSVPDPVAIPPSLKNIFKEIARDLKIQKQSGNLTPWAEQGVLLLNASLSVEEAKAGSHQKKGWETFTDTIIQNLANNKQHIVFLLWGAYAQKKIDLIDTNKHCVLTSVHPSPLSAHRGFIGCGHFSKANNYLSKHKRQSINW